jgi:hypothetical protein
VPFGHQTAWQRQALPKPEILSYPLETNVIDSAVINAAGVAADASGPYAGRRYLLAGTILSKRGDNTYERYVSAPGRTSQASCSTPWSSPTTRPSRTSRSRTCAATSRFDSDEDHRLRDVPGSR